MGWSPRQARAVVLTALLVLVLVPSSGAQSNAPPILDQRLTSIPVEPNTPVDVRIETESNTTVLLSWACSSCEVTVDDAQTGITTTTYGESMLGVHVEDEMGIDIHLTSAVTDVIEVMVLNDIDNTHHHALRPSPGTEVPAPSIGLCSTPAACIDVSTGTLSSQTTNTNDANYVHSGDVRVSEDEYIVFNASKGDTLEWQWLATTHAVNMQVYHQTSAEEVLLSGVSTSTSEFSVVDGVDGVPMYWVAPDDGRFVVRMSTDDAHALWGAFAFLHPHQPVESLVNMDLTLGANILGHGNTSAPFDWPDVEALTLKPVHAQTTVQVDQLLNGAWVAGEDHVLQAGEELHVYPYPDVDAGRIHVVNTPVFSIDVQLTTFAVENGLEAPSYLPENLDVDNASWPVANLTEATNGEFTLSIHDTTDTYRIVVDGWEDSIHFVQFVVAGDITGLELQLWDVDQGTSETLSTDITQPVGDQLKIGLQVGRGTHYLQIRFQNASQATPHLWGEHVEPRTYMLQPSYSLIDEGEEPWFPPSDDAVYWGNIARWFMGILFLLPVVYLGVHIRRSRTYAASVAEKKERLAWYTSRLDSGEANVKQARTDMAKALHAVAQLEWQDGLDAWGPERIQHRTEDIALAVWSVDERLVNNEGAWPVVVGVHVMNGTWDLAALRFDAPEGSAYEVVHVEPRFLFQGEEVFLDTMGPGHRAYLVIELSGSAQQVDVELNGRMNGEPFAARIPESLLRSETTS